MSSTRAHDAPRAAIFIAQQGHGGCTHTVRPDFDDVALVAPIERELPLISCDVNRCLAPRRPGA